MTKLSVLPPEKELEKLETRLWKQYKFPIAIQELDEGYKKKFQGQLLLTIWFNDMFGWALSYAVSFIPKKNNTVEELLSEFKNWYDVEGKKLLDSFDQVPYPDKSKHTYKTDLENYFKENYKIGEQIEQSIDKYCGAKVNQE